VSEPAGTALSRADFGELLGRMRPALHRFCARMAGSAVDGEDIVQEAMVKALAAFDAGDRPEQPEAWLFRIARNAALDHLRRTARAMRQQAADGELDMIEDPTAMADRGQIAAIALHSFMHLPVAQRSSVVLADVLGYSLQEVAAISELTLPAVKATLHRGRLRLRELATLPDDRPPPRLAPAERALLLAYADRFNARDFDAVRDMLAEEVRLELVGRTQLRGRRDVAGTYFGNYSKLHDWHLVAGFVDRRPALLLRDPNDATARPRSFILLDWLDGRASRIRDFRHVPYVAASAAFLPLDFSAP
jgi:RNA polymerase sigma-70 factor (ECF subfamily)